MSDELAVYFFVREAAGQSAVEEQSFDHSNRGFLGIQIRRSPRGPQWTDTIMKHYVPFLLCGLLVGCGSGSPTTSQGRLDEATKKLATASREEEKFYALNDAAKESFEVGKIEDARKYAQDLLALAEKFRGDWNYGNAIQDGNLVLGRIALKEGRTEEAKQYLLKAGKSPGSPQMNSFGPNMSLARDLLAKGEREVVLSYFQLCGTFWKMGHAELEQWTKEVKAGKMPDFGANLVY